MGRMTKEMLMKVTSGYEREYIEKHGDYLPWHIGFMESDEEREAVYKAALESGKTWQEITGYPQEKDVIL